MIYHVATYKPGGSCNKNLHDIVNVSRCRLVLLSKEISVERAPNFRKLQINLHFRLVCTTFAAAKSVKEVNTDRDILKSQLEELRAITYR